MDLREVFAAAVACGWADDEIALLRIYSEDLGFVGFFDVTTSGITLESIGYNDSVHCQVVARAGVAPEVTGDAEQRYGGYWFQALLNSPSRPELVEAARAIEGAISAQRLEFFRSSHSPTAVGFCSRRRISTSGSRGSTSLVAGG